MRGGGEMMRCQERAAVCQAVPHAPRAAEHPASERLCVSVCHAQKHGCSSVAGMSIDRHANPSGRSHPLTLRPSLVGAGGAAGGHAGAVLEASGCRQTRLRHAAQGGLFGLVWWLPRRRTVAVPRNRRRFCAVACPKPRGCAASSVSVEGVLRRVPLRPGPAGRVVLAGVARENCDCSCGEGKGCEVWGCGRATGAFVLWMSAGRVGVSGVSCSLVVQGYVWRCWGGRERR